MRGVQCLICLIALVRPTLVSGAPAPSFGAFSSATTQIEDPRYLGNGYVDIDTPLPASDNSAVSASATLSAEPTEYLYSGLTYSYFALAKADNGGLHAESIVAVTDPQYILDAVGYVPWYIRANAAASANYRDCFIPVPASGDRSPISISLNLTCDGQFVTTLPASASAAQGPYLAATVQVDAPQLADSFALQDGNNSLTTDTFTVPVGVYFTVYLNLTTTALITTTEGNTSGEALFGDTLTFSTNGPAFNLPDGYTINSASAGIVDNRYTVPEPSALSLAIVAGLIAYRARKSLRA